MHYVNSYFQLVGTTEIWENLVIYESGARLFYRSSFQLINDLLNKSSVINSIQYCSQQSQQWILVPASRGGQPPYKFCYDSYNGVLLPSYHHVSQCPSLSSRDWHVMSSRLLTSKIKQKIPFLKVCFFFPHETTQGEPGKPLRDPSSCSSLFWLAVSPMTIDISFSFFLFLSSSS